ncbi:MAG TPA: hypothetical protein VEI97_08325 [bacterium]|nr:hypothetical protein [bacterium]
MPGILSRLGGAFGSLFSGGRSATPQGDRPAPHVYTFAQVLNTVWKTYSYRSDEAIRHSAANALAMRRDCYLRALLQERLLPTARRKWKLEVDDDQDARQRQVKEALTDVVKAVPRFARFRRYLLEATWYGRYGSQGVWARQRVGSRDLWCFTRHQPVNGDKIQYQWDGTPAVMVTATGPYPPEELIYGDRAPMLKLTRPEWRRQFVIHTHEVEDADYFEGEMAGAVNGVGLRSHIYWSWWLRDEMLSWAVDYMQKVGTLGLLIFWYETGNKEAQAKAEQNAREASSRAALTMPRPGGKDLPTWGVEQLAPSTGGIEALQGMITDYFERHQERLTVGQSMSSGKDEGDGLGGTGRADFAKDTKYQILAWDAENLDETLTSDLVGVAKLLNFPWADFPVRFKSIVPDPEKEGKLAGLTAIWDRVPVRTEDVYEAADAVPPEDGDETVGGPQMLGPDGAPLGGLLEGRAGGEGKPPLGGILQGGRSATPGGGGLDLDQLFEADLAGWLEDGGPEGYQQYQAGAWDEGKHSRDKGKFSSQPGAKGAAKPAAAGGRSATPAAGGNPSFRDPAAVQRAWPKLKAGLAKVKGRLVGLAIDLAHGAVDPADVLPTVDDYARISALKPVDPLVQHFGIPTHDAAIVFSHAVAFLVTKAKAKLKGKPQGYAADSGDPKAELIELFRQFVGMDGDEDEPETYAAQQAHKYSCTLIRVGGDAAKRILELAAAVADEDLGEDGRETEPHITVRYGTLTNDPEDVRPVVEQHGPVRGRLGALACFFGEATGKPYDVLHVEVDSPDLLALNGALSALPHVDTHRAYKPHATVAYVKAGLGEKYLRAFRPLNQEFEASTAVFSDHGHEYTEIHLSGKAADPSPVCYYWDADTKTGVLWGRYFIGGKEVSAAEYNRRGGEDAAKAGKMKPGGGRSATPEADGLRLPRSIVKALDELAEAKGGAWSEEHRQRQSRAREKIGRNLHERWESEDVSQADLAGYVLAFAGKNGGYEEAAHAASEVLLHTHLAGAGFEYGPGKLSDTNADGWRVNCKFTARSGVPVAKLEGDEKIAHRDVVPKDKKNVYVRLIFSAAGDDPAGQGVFVYAGPGTPQLYSKKDGYGDGIDRPKRVVSMEEYRDLLKSDPAELDRRIREGVTGLDRKKYREVMNVKNRETLEAAVEALPDLIRDAKKEGIKLTPEQAKELRALLEATESDGKKE